MKKIVLIVAVLVCSCFAFNFDSKAFEKDVSHPCKHIEIDVFEDAWIYDDTVIIWYDLPGLDKKVKEVKVWRDWILGHGYWRMSERIGTAKIIPEHFGVEWDK